jgi:hypothetical protein
MWSHAEYNIFALYVLLLLVRTTGGKLRRFYLATATKDCPACESIIASCICVGAWRSSSTCSIRQDVNDNWASHLGQFTSGGIAPSSHRRIPYCCQESNPGCLLHTACESRTGGANQQCLKHFWIITIWPSDDSNRYESWTISLSRVIILEIK